MTNVMHFTPEVTTLSWLQEIVLNYGIAVETYAKTGNNAMAEHFAKRMLVAKELLARELERVKPTC